MPHTETPDAGATARKLDRRPDLGWLANRHGELSEREAAQRVAEFRGLLRDAARHARMPHAFFLRLRAFRQWS